MNAVATIEHAPQTRDISSATPGELLRIAIDRGVDVVQLERLMDLQIKYEANEARKAYVEAMAAFKKNPPEIIKRSQVSYKTSSGVTEYMHADLGEVCSQVVSALAAHGFSHGWQINQLDSGQIEVTCVLTHSKGHSELTKLRSSADSSGGKNSIQAMASTITYLERYTLLAATGLATKGMDDDGRSAELTLITDDQLGELESLITQVAANKQQFLKFLKVKSLGDLPQKAFKTAIAALEAKRLKVPA